MFNWDEFWRVAFGYRSDEKFDIPGGRPQSPPLPEVVPGQFRPNPPKGYPGHTHIPNPGEKIIWSPANQVDVKIKLFPDGRVPTRSKEDDTCYDVYASEDVWCLSGSVTKVNLGFALECPKGFGAQIRPRSGLGSNGIISILGTVDNGYRGEICALVHNSGQNLNHFMFRKGERVAQMCVEKIWDIQFQIVEELGISDRGENGLGSTGP